MSKKKKYALRTPLNVKGGIRAQNPHSGHLRVWWSRRWTEVLENFRLGARLGRGRNYAVTGQVFSLEIAPGQVAATVQGSNREPYESAIRFRTVEGESKARLIQALRQRPMLVARLLVADLPFEVEALFREAGCPLFPQRGEKDLVSRCSCPDYVNPCKHLAAVYYLLGEAITKNPLLLLELRGISRADLLGAALDPAGPTDLPEASGPSGTPELSGFYGETRPPFDDFGPAVKSVTPAPLIYRLGPLPFWRGQERFTDTMEHLYARAATRGWTVWTGEALDLRREDEKVIIKGASLHLKQRKMRVDTSWM
ncbi:MAG TPA: SWIM zinc finger family protein [Kiritimatiellia bacterium]|nr:SWIM zinc finger family protein [Kiritimatiellia bacterium]HPS06369.1 SWIM zinc finger family protein [Kiritimatiellia bacterium]